MHKCQAKPYINVLCLISAVVSKCIIMQREITRTRKKLYLILVNALDYCAVVVIRFLLKGRA